MTASFSISFDSQLMGLRVHMKSRELGLPWAAWGVVARNFRPLFYGGNFRV